MTRSTPYKYDSLTALIDQKMRGWEWVASEFRRVQGEVRAEAERLLGPERGE